MSHYPGPGPAVIGEAEYAKVMQQWNDTAGGTIGSAITAPLVPACTEDPVLDRMRAEAQAAKAAAPEEPTEITFAQLHVQTALAKIKGAGKEECVAWLFQEENRAQGPRPTVLVALKAKIG